ncbi:MAG: low molecular weight protein arginine phosphatase [Oscillospiraceae bacterium]|jgi:protein-tyrosine-phosphatase|nr:low molecular weight protein arginine phosphatase [Oscillospiraceae bacterium]
MRVLFVCTGNTCRSPLAEVLCRALKPDWEARSGGLAAYEGADAASFSIEAARGRGCDLTEHKARMVREEDMVWADAVYGLTAAHVAMLRTVFPACADKVRTLPGGDVPDPLGGTLSDYRACAERLKEDIAQL